MTTKLITYGAGDTVRCLSNQLTASEHDYQDATRLIVGKEYVVKSFREPDTSYPPMVKLAHIASDSYIPSFLFELVKRDKRIRAGDKVRLKPDALTNRDPLDDEYDHSYWSQLDQIDPNYIYTVKSISVGYRYLLFVDNIHSNGVAGHVNGHYFERVNPTET